MLTIEGIASIAHEANRALCKQYEDYTQIPWDFAPQWQKDSAIDGVKFHLANPGSGPSASHLNWMNLKISEGWVYGDVKDADKKTHPCIVPYDELPSFQQSKDYLFAAIVSSLEKFKDKL